MSDHKAVFVVHTVDGNNSVMYAEDAETARLNAIAQHEQEWTDPASGETFPGLGEGAWEVDEVIDLREDELKREEVLVFVNKALDFEEGQYVPLADIL